MSQKRENHEPPDATAKRGWRYHHLGIPHADPRPGEEHLERLGVHVRGFETSPYGIEWMRFDAHCQVPEIVRTLPHIAFAVDDLDEALKGKEILIAPNTPSEGVRVAFILDDGAPIELIEFGARGSGLGAGAGMRPKPKTIDEYLAGLSTAKRAALEKLRKDIRAAAPKAEECISYSIPAFRLDGRVLVFFGAASRHCSFYPGAYPIEALKEDLAGYETSKGTIRFPEDEPLPARLVRKLVKARIEEQTARRERRQRPPGQSRAPV